MVLWGGLLPIPHHVLADALTCLGWGYTVSTTPTRENFQLFLATCIMTVAVSGNLTNKWTMIFPMWPLIVLQTLRRLLPTTTKSTVATMTTTTKNEKKTSTNSKIVIWSSRILTILSILLIVIAGILSILFPALQLPLPVTDEHYHSQTTTTKIPRYHVGLVDTFLPVKQLTFDNYQDTGTRPGPQQDHVTVRILYPTSSHNINDSNNDNSNRQTKTITATTTPYLRPETAKEFCAQTMKYGSPPPLKEFYWMLHNWRLGKLPNVYRHAPPIEKSSEKEEEVGENDSSSSSSSSSSWPIIVYSHGLGGTAEMYSYQTVALASAGFIVLVIEHADGSAAVVPQKDGTKLLRDTSVEQQWFNGEYVKYARTRRAMVQHRADELLSALESFVSLNIVNLPELDALGVNFVGKLNTKEIHYMGHSFGASTILHAAHHHSSSRRYSNGMDMPQSSQQQQQRALKLPLPATLIAHEPVLDWIPDETRRSLFEDRRLQGGRFYDEFDGLTGGYETNLAYGNETTAGNFSSSSSSIHDFDMLVLWSHEWIRNPTAPSHILVDMHERGQFGTRRKVVRGEEAVVAADDEEQTISRVKVIDQAHHNEFSDTCMLTPLWIARGSNITGSRNPLDTAKEIHQHTLDFLRDWERKQTKKKGEAII